MRSEQAEADRFKRNRHRYGIEVYTAQDISVIRVNPTVIFSWSPSSRPRKDEGNGVFD
jgi:hypothetical protein